MRTQSLRDHLRLHVLTQAEWDQLFSFDQFSIRADESVGSEGQGVPPQLGIMQNGFQVGQEDRVLGNDVTPERDVL